MIGEGAVDRGHELAKILLPLNVKISGMHSKVHPPKDAILQKANFQIEHV